VPDTDVVYCEGWDSVRREAHGTMTEATAAARDRDGAQYAVLLRDSGRPVALLQVAWAAGYLGVSLFDERARRLQQLDFRVLDDPGRLYWSGFRAWTPGSPHDPEFFDKQPQIVLSIDQDGQAEANSSYSSRGGGGHVSTRPRIPAELRTIARAPFGDWRSYMGPALFDPVTAPPVGPAGARSAADPAGEDGAPPEAARSGWTPPAALGPRHIEALFTPGTRLRCVWGVWSEGQIATVSELRQPGMLRLPTGRVVAEDPGFVREDSEPFTVTVPPGEYPVSIASAACEIEVGTAGNRTTVLDEYVTAVRVLIRDEPAATWEMALRPGQDPRMLPTGRFFGFGVDSGMGAFLDAAGRQALRARYAAAEEEAPGERPAGLARWTEDPVSGANMVAYNSGAGDGAYPVWIGRNREGQVVSLVADMLLLGDAELLSPGAASTARYVLPGPVPRTGAGLTARPASALALGRYIEKLLLVPLEAAAALAVAEEPVCMPSHAATFAPRRRPDRGSPPQDWPELRFPDRDRAVEADPRVHTHMGHAHMLREVTRRNYDDALAAYTLAVELAPDYAVALGGRGDAFRLLGRNAEALADLTRAIELHPNFSAAYICRARTHYALGRYAEALADYDRFDGIGFTGTGSGYAPVIDKERRGDICRRLGRYDEALTCFSRALDYVPDDAVALSRRGDTFRLLGRNAEALADLTRAIELDPDLPGAHASRGAVYQALGRDEEACADLARAAELAPGHDPL
jgi:Flp pilus assembly protein TadD